MKKLFLLASCFLIFLLFFYYSNAQSIALKDNQPPPPPPPTDLIKISKKNDYIFLNTIDGQLYAIGKHDGKIKWSIKEDAVLNFPKDYENPYFLTDPRDGSLYIFTSKQDGLKKFPLTIAQLVTASPSKSADGFLYTGDKKDQWLAIDYRNGNKLDTLTSESFSSKVSSSGNSGNTAADYDDYVLFIGRTRYTISMFDLNTRKKIFNLTYYDYSTHSAASNNNKNKQTTLNNDYPNYHFTSSSDGTLITLDKRNGDLRWSLQLDTPIVAMYRYEQEQLFKISFSIYSREALAYLAESHKRIQLLFKQQKQSDLIASNKNKPNKEIDSLFSETLYIGFYNKNLYALPTFIYNSKLPLIEGPMSEQPMLDEINDTQNQNQIDYDDINYLIDMSDSSQLTPGHHELPDELSPSFIQPNDKQQNGGSQQNENLKYLQDLFNIKNPEICSVDTEPGKKKAKKISVWQRFDLLMQNKYIWSIFTVFLASLFPIAKTFYDYKKKKARQLLKEQLKIMQQAKQTELSSTSNSEDDDYVVDSLKAIESKNSSESSSLKQNKTKSTTEKSTIHQNVSDNSSDFHLHNSYSMPELRSDGLIKIGKLTYDPKHVLGHGCAGTFVYKGTFENRPVAVKRLLPECYTLADREVELLRDADQHSNVLRYFCTESDSQFRYIALELCQMTLYEYVNNQHSTLRPLSILEQATRGLDHLHSLDIVHRDIKPQNVLISFPDQKGNVYVMISDFGLCKRLETGINSFSKRSGITGTDGWIAAELIDDVYINNSRTGDTNSDDSNSNTTNNKTNVNLNESNQDATQTTAADAAGNNSNNSGGNVSGSAMVVKRVTKNVDIFSLGCVYYFVLSGGSHPFGDSIRRQLNILSNEYKLDKLLSNLWSEVHMQRILVDKMISNEPKKRPSTKEILAHPIFWNKAKTLQFLQDVSDRIEKIEPDDPIQIELERNANVAIKNNWKCHICAQLQNDLKKFRSYNGVSVRDLLRAIRNKKHHYRELPPEVKQSLGNLPDEFIDYFTTRFPKLIMHVYDAMRCCADEPMLDVYYKIMNNH